MVVHHVHDVHVHVHVHACVHVHVPVHVLVQKVHVHVLVLALALYNGNRAQFDGLFRDSRCVTGVDHLGHIFVALRRLLHD